MKGFIRLAAIYGLVHLFLLVAFDCAAARFVYSYDGNVQLLSVAKYGDQATGYTYDDAGNLVSAEYALSDLDGDGLPDAWEIQYGLDPENSGDSSADTDTDGLTNAEEYAAGTDPTQADSDGDGYTDAEEIAAGTNPLDPFSHPGQAYGVPAINGWGVLLALIMISALAGLALRSNRFRRNA